MSNLTQPLQELQKEILIADDDEELKENLIHVIKRIAPKFNCHCVDDGQRALEAIQAKKYDVLILDLMMPKMDGKGLVESLVGVEQYHRPSFLLVISGSIQGGIRRIGKTTFLPKPFSTEDLQNYFTSIFEASVAAPQPRQTTQQPKSNVAVFSLAVEQALEGLCSTQSTRSKRTETNTSPNNFQLGALADITIESTLCYAKMLVRYSLRMEKNTFLRIIARMLGEPHIEIKPELYTAAAELSSQIIEFLKQANTPDFQDPLATFHNVTVGSQHQSQMLSESTGYTEVFQTDVGAITFSLTAMDF